MTQRYMLFFCDERKNTERVIVSVCYAHLTFNAKMRSHPVTLPS